MGGLFTVKGIGLRKRDLEDFVDLEDSPVLYLALPSVIGTQELTGHELEELRGVPLHRPALSL